MLKKIKLDNVRCDNVIRSYHYLFGHKNFKLEYKNLKVSDFEFLDLFLKSYIIKKRISKKVLSIYKLSFVRYGNDLYDVSACVFYFYGDNLKLIDSVPVHLNSKFFDILFCCKGN